MNWENMELSKIDNNYKKSCLTEYLFNRIAVLEISKSSQEITCGGALFL